MKIVTENGVIELGSLIKSTAFSVLTIVREVNRVLGCLVSDKEKEMLGFRQGRRDPVLGMMISYLLSLLISYFFKVFIFLSYKFLMKSYFIFIFLIFIIFSQL